MSNPDEYVTGHKFSGLDEQHCGYVTADDEFRNEVMCNQPRAKHADPANPAHLIEQYPHEFKEPPFGSNFCSYTVSQTGETDPGMGGIWRVCGYPEAEHHAARKPVSVGAVVRMADVAQYAREPMPDRARAGITVTLIDAPTDPLGTLAVLTGMYEGRVSRAKSEVTDEQRRAAYDAMMATVLSGPLEAVQFTFLVEGVSRAITHQMVRNRFSFFAQESLRFAVADDWAQEVPLPPSLLGRRDDDPLVMVWRRSLNRAEDGYASLVAAGMPAEEARGLLPHAITTRLYWTVSLRTLLMEAGKRTCTQAQFDWRILFGGVAQALRERAGGWGNVNYESAEGLRGDGWQYELFADAIRPVCYQQGKCGFMAKFDRGCTIRNRVDANEKLGRPSSEWGTEYDVVDPSEIVVGVGPRSVVVDEQERPVFIGAINPQEWAADPAAARVPE